MDYRTDSALQRKRKSFASTSAAPSRRVLFSAALFSCVAVAALVSCALLSGVTATARAGRLKATSGVTKVSTPRNARRQTRTPANKFDAKQTGLQLYSLRREFAKDVPGTLASETVWHTNVEKPATTACLSRNSARS